VELAEDLEVEEFLRNVDKSYYVQRFMFIRNSINSLCWKLEYEYNINKFFRTISQSVIYNLQ